MRGLVSAAFAVIVCAHPAVADERYDRTLAEAAAGIVAARMDGKLRGGFGQDAEPLLQAPAETSPPQPAKPPRPGIWRDGLAIAVERKSSVSPEL